MTIPAGLPPPRPDQGYAPSGSPMAPGSPNVVRARKVIVTGTDGGVFIFDGSGNLLISEAGAPGTINGQTYLQGMAVYVTISGQRIALQIGEETIGGSPAAAFFIHNMTSPPFTDPGFSANLASPSGAAAEIVSGQSTAGSAQAAIIVADSTLSGVPGGEIELIAGQVILNNGASAIPVADPGGFPLPADANSGTAWASGERAFMNNNWIAPVNALFSALQAAGILQ